MTKIFLLVFFLITSLYGQTRLLSFNYAKINTQEIDVESTFQKEKSGRIFGRIVDKATGEGLTSVNIYISKTTIGTSSDMGGFFEIKNISNGEYYLVVSMIGYEPEIINFEIKDNNRRINVQLKEKAYELESIEIVADKSIHERYVREQERYKRIFKKYFLGHTDLSNKCKIVNEDKIKFKKDEQDNITATCSEPVIIINDALGYKIECLIYRFVCNDFEGSSQLLYFPRYIEMNTTVNLIEKNWEKNRQRSYTSSLRRFIESVYNHKVDENNYGMAQSKNYNFNGKFKGNIVYDESEISRIDSTTNEVFLSFEGLLLIENKITGETSGLMLPKGECKILANGTYENLWSLRVYETFASHGLANFLPENVKY